MIHIYGFFYVFTNLGCSFFSYFWVLFGVQNSLFFVRAAYRPLRPRFQHFRLNKFSCSPWFYMVNQLFQVLFLPFFALFFEFFVFPLCSLCTQRPFPNPCMCIFLPLSRTLDTRACCFTLLLVLKN